MAKKVWVNRYIEPGEAVGRHCGYYVETVIDIIDNNERLLFVIFR